jgi:hypothetical protein
LQALNLITSWPYNYHSINDVHKISNDQIHCGQNATSFLKTHIHICERK